MKILKNLVFLYSVETLLIIFKGWHYLYRLLNMEYSLELNVL